MKKIFTLFSAFQLLFFTFNATSQVNQWVWLHGSSVPNGLPTYGTQGVSSNTNEPPAVYEPCEWRDTSGNFWVFGGKDHNNNFYGDLWRYKPSTNQWTWMKGYGFTNDPGNYGTKGVPSVNNYPPTVGYGVPTWTDLNNNLWLYGGAGAPNKDALWRYNIATNEWTWIKGDSSFSKGVFGTLGVPDTANHPGYLSETAATWTDAAGDLWFFGGQTLTGAMNDMWRYTIATNTWTWMKGSQLGYQFAKYGTQGVEKSTNTPSGREAYCHWKDKNGNFWLFGGYDGTTSQYNDMWRFNPATNNWTWMAGTNILYEQGSASAECTFASNNVPYSRWENRACWTDAQGNFWLFGGGIAGSNGFSTTWNNLWKFCVESNQFVWISGDTAGNVAGSWGTRGVSSATNVPNGRAGDVGWSDMKGHFYIYGGTTQPFFLMYNDLWKYTVDTTCGVCQAAVLPLASFLSSDTMICANDCINFTDLSSNATSWSWTFQGALPPTSTDQNPQGVCYLNAGTYDVTLAVSNGFGKDTMKVSSFIVVSNAPATPSITISNDTLYCSTDTSYAAYQWYKDTTLISGATTNILVISGGGNYNVQVSNSVGCKVAVGIVLGIQNPFTVYGLQFTPNPVSDELMVSGYPLSGKEKLVIYNSLGQNIYSSDINGKQETVNCELFAAGIYFLQVQSQDKIWNAKFVKE